MKLLLLMLLLSGVVALNGLDLQCKFQKIDWTYVKGMGCVALNVNIETPGQVITSVNGQNVESFDGSSYKLMEFTNQVLHFIPEGLGKFFPNLQELEIYESELKEVQKKDLVQFPNLVELHLSDNELEILPSDLFQGNPELFLISFNSNNLIHVGENILSPLTKLKDAYFQGNKCIKKAFTQAQIPTLVTDLETNCRNETIARILEPRQSLEEQESCKTDLKSVTKQLVAANASLKTTDETLDEVSRLLFSCITTSSCENLLVISSDVIDMKCKFDKEKKTCETIDLIMNVPGSKINEVSDEQGSAISDFSSVQNLSIINQKTLFLPANLGEKFPNLVELEVISSGLFLIDDKTFSKLFKLSTIKITLNKLRHVPSNTFADNLNLLELDLSFNEIEIFSDNAFKNLGKLQQLDLQYNFLTSISSDAFANLLSLKTLKLQINKLKAIDVDLIRNLSKLSHIDISNNDIEKLPENLVKPKNSISEFYANRNKLKVIERKLIRRLKASTIVDLASNDCIDVLYEKNGNGSITFDQLLSKVHLECSEEDKED